MSGSIQSSNYVPGVSGWKLNTLTGEFEINSCTMGSAASAPERQMVSVEVASWSKYDLPKNAANLLQFMQAELQKVPEEYRHVAEFEEFDASYGDESFNARLFLSYSRLETEEELAYRLAKAKAKAKAAGTQISIKNGLMTVTHDGVARIKIGNLDQPKPEQPFKVDGDQVYISEAFVRDAIIDSTLAAKWSVKMQSGVNGPYVAGIGLALKAGGIATAIDKVTIRELTGFEKALAEGDASKILDMLEGKITKTELCRQVLANTDQLGSSLADQVKAVIRNELMQGGLLHRSR